MTSEVFRLVDHPCALATGVAELSPEISARERFRLDKFATELSDSIEKRDAVERPRCIDEEVEGVRGG